MKVSKKATIFLVILILMLSWIFFGLPQEAKAAARTVQDVTGQTAGNVGSVTVSSIPGGIDQLYVAVVALYTDGGTPGTSEVSSMSGANLIWVLITGTVGCTRITQARTEMWWAFGSPSSFNLTVNLKNTTGNSAGAHVAVVRVSNAANSMPINGEYANINGDQGACVSGTDNSTLTIGATVSNKNSLILNQAYPRNQADGVSTPDANYTEQYEVLNISSGNASTIWIGTRANPAVGIETITHSLGSNRPWIMGVIEIQEAPSKDAFFQLFD